MSSIFQHGLSFLHPTFSLINEAFKPNPKHFSNKIAQETAHIRNKVLLLSQFLLALILFFDTLNHSPTFLPVIRFSTIGMIILILYLSCRYHPRIFNIFIWILCLAYGPATMSIGEGGIHRALSLVLNLPMFLYVSTGSLWGFISQTVFQMIYINTWYKSKMGETLLEMTPQAFNISHTWSINMSFVFSCAQLVLINFSMEKAYKHMSIVEKKKDEFENQKIFLLGFSHELRNLINSLTGNVKLATFEHLPHRAKELLLNAEVCGEMLLHLVNNILDSGKVEIGELEINPVSTRIYDTMERIWGVCSELIRRKNLRGQMKIPRNLPRTMIIDHYRLTQIFLNLVGNAVKFTDSGSVDIIVEWITHSEPTHEDIFEPYPLDGEDEFDEGLFQKQKVFSMFDPNLFSLNLSTQHFDKNLLKKPGSISKGILKVSINDTGCGMSSEETARLFQKFTQVTSDVSKKKLGTGLGLFITKQLCQKMYGDVKVFSKKGVGSSFIFYIPVHVGQEETEHVRDLESIKGIFMSKKLKAMIVDDAPFNHTVLKCFFDKLGIEVIDIAVNGLEAYKNYKRHIEMGNHPDIVTMDLDMPIMDGKEAARKIRRLEMEKGLEPCFMPIISGNCTGSEISECLNKDGQIKADVFMKKPATIEELVRAISRHFIR